MRDANFEGGMMLCLYGRSGKRNTAAVCDPLCGRTLGNPHSTFRLGPEPHLRAAKFGLSVWIESDGRKGAARAGRVACIGARGPAAKQSCRELQEYGGSHSRCGGLRRAGMGRV